MQSAGSRRTWFRLLLRVICTLVFLTSTLHVATASAAPSKTNSRWWDPPAGISWQYQLSGRINATTDADVFDIDGFDNSAATVRKIHANGAKAICYISGGSREDWRPDASAFSREMIGDSNDWEGEAWLDIRQINVLLPIMEKRVQMCKKKEFDAVEFDNVDGYTNDTGFSLSASHQIRYNKALAALAHKYRMAAVLKNDGEQVRSLVAHFDAAVVEQCHEYDECDVYAPFTKADKPVFVVEYETDIAAICKDAKAKKFSVLKKDLDLSSTSLKAC